MKHKKLKITLAASLATLLLAFVALTVHASFTTRVYVYTDTGKKVAHVGMNLQLLFGKLAVADDTDLKIPSYTVTSNGLVQYKDGVTNNTETGDDQRTLFDADAPWGSAQNPYVISEPRHLQNLSALHSVGYFDLLYIANNFDASGNYIPGSASIPYFLICDPETGKPVTISGEDIESAIEPIGSAEHPFIGVVGGAFTEGETTVIDGDGNAETLADNKVSVASTIHHFKVKTSTKQTDVGLFGYIGYLGDESTAGNTNQFAGVFSSVKNVLISDVSVVVNNPDVDEIISELFKPLWKKLFSTADGEVFHRFSYTGQTEEMPHETNHIGIFAGHVSYAMVDNISIYYSDDEPYAIDLTDVAEKNYYSASGILGMMYNMNCTIANDATLGCVIKMGTGMSSDEIGTSGSGSGTGGGQYSGNGRGYVTAAEIFTTFNNVYVANENEELLWKYKDADGTWVENAILILEKVADSQTTYTFMNGNPAYISGDKTVVADGTGDGANTWSKFFIRKVVNSTGEDGKEGFEYVSRTNAAVTNVEMLGNKYNGEVLWKYCAGGDNIWHYGIRVYKDDTTYKLEDGSPVSYDTENNLIKYVDDNGTTTTWQSFFISEQIDASTMSHYMYDPAGKKWMVSTFERKPLPLIKAYGENIETSTMELLCKEAGDNLYYFYDGVFTFGLSSADDSVRDTWKNDTTPDLYLGPNNASGWEVNQDRRDNRTLVALLKPVKDNEQLNQAIAEGKQFYISAQPNSSDASTQYTTQYFMSLMAGSTAEGGKYMPNPVSSTPVVMDGTMQTLLMNYYKNGTYKNAPMVPLTNADGSTYEVPMYKSYTTKANGDRVYTYFDAAELGTTEFWTNGNYTVLNIGRTSTGDNGMTLQELKDNYNIVPANVTEGGQTKYYYYRDKTGAYVGMGNGSESIKVKKQAEYSEYIYYTVSYEVPGTKGDLSSGFGIRYNEEDGSYTWNGGGWTYGYQSGTAYERVRIYTFTFYYQPADHRDPIPLGTTSVRIIGAGTTYRGSTMPNFIYGMVYYGQGESAYEESASTTGYNGTALNHLLSLGIDSEIIPAGGTIVDPNDNDMESSVTYDKVDNSFTFISNRLKATITATDQTENGGVRLFNISSTIEGVNPDKAVPMINLSANRFHGTNTQRENESTEVVVSGGYASVELTGTQAGTESYYYLDVSTGNYYEAGSTTALNMNTYNPGNRILLKRYQAYTFGSNTTTASRSYLQLLHQFRGENYADGQTGDEFSLWAGTELQYTGTGKKPSSVSNGNTSGFTGLWMAKGHTTEAVLIFESGGTCYIQYTYDNKTDDSYGGMGSGNNWWGGTQQTQHILTRYVSYEALTTGGYKFSLSETKQKLYVYVIEGVIDAATGVNTFKPTDNSNSVVLDGDQYVLWPQTTLTQDGYTNNTGYNSDTKEVIVSSSTKDDTLNAKLNSTADPVYKVIPLVGTGGLNWGDDEGYKLGATTTTNGKKAHGLDKKFQAAAQSFFGGVSVGADGNISEVFKSNLMVAPVGSNGVNSLLPKGSVAFQVNAEGTQTIRIIVAIPTTTKYLTETEFDKTMDLVNDYYVGVWKLPEIVEGGNYSFSLAGAVEKFELPRSYAFASDASPSTVENLGAQKHYTLVEYGGQQYRTYLNGDTFLVAYQFTIQGSDKNAGTYVIGNAHVSSGYASTDVPMEIVHFSVSGTASAGRDGVAGSQLGAIDFVYDDTANTIVTVGTESQQNSLPNADGNEYYSNYYASQCMLYTNTEKNVSGGGYIKINKVRLYVRRRLKETAVTGGTSTYDTVLSYYVGSSDTNQTDAFTIRRYLMAGDTLEKLTAEPGSNTSGG